MAAGAKRDTSAGFRWRAVGRAGEGLLGQLEAWGRPATDAASALAVPMELNSLCRRGGAGAGTGRGTWPGRRPTLPARPLRQQCSAPDQPAAVQLFSFCWGWESRGRDGPGLASAWCPVSPSIRLLPTCRLPGVPRSTDSAGCQQSQSIPHVVAAEKGLAPWTLGVFVHLGGNTAPCAAQQTFLCHSAPSECPPCQAQGGRARRAVVVSLLSSGLTAGAQCSFSG